LPEYGKAKEIPTHLFLIYLYEDPVQSP